MHSTLVSYEGTDEKPGLNDQAIAMQFDTNIFQVGDRITADHRDGQTLKVIAYQEGVYYSTLVTRDSQNEYFNGAHLVPGTEFYITPTSY